MTKQGRYFSVIMRGKRRLSAFSKPRPRTNAEAFAESIRKWRFIAKETERVGKLLDVGEFCALCELHKRDGGCGDCPIVTLAGDQECRNTPFWKYREARTKDQAVRAAKSEILFLRAVAVMAK